MTDDFEEDSKSANQTPIVGNEFTMPKDDVTILGTFKTQVGDYEVFISDSTTKGKVKTDRQLANEGAPVRVTTTADEGYMIDTISCQTTEGAAVVVTDKTFTMPASDVTVSATFIEAPEVYTVTFNARGGTDVPSVEVEENKKIPKPTEDPTKEGFKFAGWYTDENRTQK